jgi:hypothetical protein
MGVLCQGVCNRALMVFVLRKGGMEEVRLLSQCRARAEVGPNQVLEFDSTSSLLIPYLTTYPSTTTFPSHFNCN